MKTGWYLLTYHDISWEENIYMKGIGGTCPPDIFEDQVKEFSKNGELVSFEEGLKRCNENNINSPLFSFWFDDGFKGNRIYGKPILDKYNITAASAVCSRFVLKKELFWCAKLSYIFYKGYMPILKNELYPLGYKSNLLVKNFTLNNFSLEILSIIDNVYNEITTERERLSAFDLFDNTEGLKELKKAGWLITNHSAAHYPIGEERNINLFKNQYKESEEDLKELMEKGSDYLSLPFDRSITLRSPKIYQYFPELGNNKHIVFGGRRVNTPQNTPSKIIYRVAAQQVPGKDLIKFIKQEAFI